MILTEIDSIYDLYTGHKSVHVGLLHDHDAYLRVDTFRIRYAVLLRSEIAKARPAEP